MVTYFNDSDSDDNTPPRVMPKKPLKLLCKQCGNNKECQKCKLKTNNAQNKLDNVSLVLLTHLDSPWITKDYKLSYLYSLNTLITQIQQGGAYM